MTIQPDPFRESLYPSAPSTTTPQSSRSATGTIAPDPGSTASMQGKQDSGASSVVAKGRELVDKASKALSSDKSKQLVAKGRDFIQANPMAAAAISFGAGVMLMRALHRR